MSRLSLDHDLSQCGKDTIETENIDMEHLLKEAGYICQHIVNRALYLPSRGKSSVRRQITL
jgi:hypothetical protein